MTTRWSFAFFMSYDEITNQYGYGAVEISWRIIAPGASSPFSLIQNRTDISLPVQHNSHAKQCISQRKALQLPTQSFASANAKLCICSRKALQLSAQCIACGITII